MDHVGDELAALRASVEELYPAFAAYPLRADVSGCAHCVTPNDLARIMSKPLRELRQDDLDPIASSVLLTWGTGEDFKHFLPRLFELIATDPGVMMLPEIVLGRVRDARWQDWPRAERLAVNTYLTTVWRAVLAYAPCYLHPVGGPMHSGCIGQADHALCAIGQAVDDLHPYLEAWRRSPSATAVYHLTAFFDANVQQLRKRQRLANGFWSARPAQMQQAIDWLRELARSEAFDGAYLAQPDAPCADSLAQLADRLRLLK
jgi:hypothetical protein